MIIQIAKIIAGTQSMREKANSNKRASNGNIPPLKILTWNKTNVNIVDRMNEIQKLIKTIKPAVMFVQELNLNEHQSKSLTNIKNYKFISDNLIITNKTARLGCWISNDLIFLKLKT